MLKHIKQAIITVSERIAFSYLNLFKFAKIAPRAYYFNFILAHTLIID